ncbi:hypothetical protein COB11_06355 [Candidatus Aerophobetes bacterium]|uniref:histidine kinase n=1 Tax=Aerophobetes bacterium TaxID=2030807 RepID=A0A2A4YDA8_UNCAE|nr:MAG: hypothetical protein COB11_06355 [Candidatus Aerophobetes bacterium]
METTKGKILVVEDDQGDALLVEKYFAELHYLYDLEIVPDLQQATTALQQNQYSLILTDLSLPDSTNPENTFDIILQNAKDTAVVLMTGLEDDKLAIKFMEKGAQDYLVKGQFNETLLKRVIAYAIERKSVQLQLKIANESLKHASELKSEFVSMVSHELRSPLTYIGESLEMVLDGSQGEVNEKQKETLQMGKDGIKRLLGLINDILDISKIEAGKMEISVQDHNLTDVVHLCAEQLKGPYQKKNLELVENVPNEPTMISFDRDRIIQVFTNLLTNALKFTESGRVEVGFTVQEQVIECFVKDSGRGLSKENAKCLFTRFEQFGERKAGTEKGTGLGLNISKKIIELHSGTMRVESEEGKGSTFIFTLPKVTSIKKAS